MYGQFLTERGYTKTGKHGLKLSDLSTISTTFIFWKVRCSLFPDAVVYFNSTASKEDIYCGEIDAEFISKK